jgi:uncharacterized protein
VNSRCCQSKGRAARKVREIDGRGPPRGVKFLESLSFQEVAMARVVHFEIPAKDPKRAVEFYKAVFDWDIKKWEGPMDYYLAETGKKSDPGIDGAIMGMDGTAKSTVNTVGVASLDDTVAKIKKAGGKQVTKKDEIPNIGMFCYCEDPEGNLIGVLEPFPGSSM